MRRKALYLTLTPCLLAACAREGLVDSRLVPVAGASNVEATSAPESLAAAVDPTAEIAGPLTSPEEQESPGPRGVAYGLRCGAMTAGEPGWEPGFRAGVYYRAMLRRRWPLELGLDFSSLEGENGATLSDLTYLRADVLFRTRRAGEGRASAYLLAGFEVAYERAEYPLRGDETEGYVPGLNAGLGLGPPSGRWDVRLQYTLLIGKDDTAGEGVLVVAVGF